ncbi:MAG: molybdopterin-guanine dinucleotide biosynthesis protein B [Thermodesulfovibrionales bacterium]
MTPACIIGLSGHSGSGKTTLIEKVLPLLKREGLSVGVLKHTSHHILSLDQEGKDTDRFYRAGAEVVAAQDTTQIFSRFADQEGDLLHALGVFPCGLDLVIVEGHKGSNIPKAWFESKAPQPDAHQNTQYKTVICRDDPGHVEKFLEFIREELGAQLQKRPVFAGLLIGGKSSRMGRPKTLLEISGTTLVERAAEVLSGVSQRVLLLGSAELPGSMLTADRLPDAADSRGPLSGMLSAFRWDFRSTWLMSSVDMPLMRREAWEWLLAQRRPGAWAVMPQREGSEKVEVTGACYEPMIFGYAESLAQKGIARLHAIASHPKVLKPVVPKHLEDAWGNVNTPDEWERILSAAGQ